METHFVEVHDDQARWLATANEKVSWCDDVSGDKFSVEAKLAALQVSRVPSAIDCACNRCSGGVAENWSFAARDSWMLNYAPLLQLLQWKSECEKQMLFESALLVVSGCVASSLSLYDSCFRLFRSHLSEVEDIREGNFIPTVQRRCTSLPQNRRSFATTDVLLGFDRASFCLAAGSKNCCNCFW